jgi:hypothetical protein
VKARSTNQEQRVPSLMSMWILPDHPPRCLPGREVRLLCYIFKITIIFHITGQCGRSLVVMMSALQCLLQSAEGREFDPPRPYTHQILFFAVLVAGRPQSRPGTPPKILRSRGTSSQTWEPKIPIFYCLCALLVQPFPKISCRDEKFSNQTEHEQHPGSCN